jgi:hypothetical protein
MSVKLSRLIVFILLVNLTNGIHAQPSEDNRQTLPAAPVAPQNSRFDDVFFLGSGTFGLVDTK